jgi:cytochrome c oxidase assembly protein subunit 11
MAGSSLALARSERRFRSPWKNSSLQVKKYLTLLGILAGIGVMTTLVSYSVTLYRLFCAATGSGGFVQRVNADTANISVRAVTVFFNTDVAPGLPWRFVPVQRKVTVHLGQQTPAFFEAENRADQDIVGHATFNVTPTKAAKYFKKTQCFCFTEERLAAHHKVEMPVVFFVDPALGADPDTEDVDQITLSYTFFRSLRPNGAKDLTRFSRQLSADLGGQLFAQDCSGCHELHGVKVGPPLGGVIGRRAGSVAGYHYSPALAQSGIIWNEQTLDKWLAGPQAYVPGALMPLAVADAAARRDIIAYLKGASTQRTAQAKPAG